jgi:hypothetical protein
MIDLTQLTAERSYREAVTFNDASTNVKSPEDPASIGHSSSFCSLA